MILARARFLNKSAAVTEHLIHIGYPKSGSSYLQNWFRNHPQMRYVEGGFAGAANIHDFVSQAFDDDTAYRWRVTRDEGLSVPNRDFGRPPGSAWPSSAEVRAAQFRACERLATLFPTAHILIVTRGFRTALLSSYSQYVRRGGDVDFALYQAGYPTFAPLNYDALIAAYRSAFGDRVTVLPYEMLATDRHAFLRELEARLGIERFDGSALRINQALSGTELRWYPRIARLVYRLPRWCDFVRRRYLRAVFDNRLRRPIAVLDRIWPCEPVTDALLLNDWLRPMTEQAKHLVTEPLFGPFVSEYRF